MSLGAGAFLGGAQGRLLPPSIPFRFFAAAVAFHVAFWALLLAAAAELPDFVGGPGLPLAAAHLLTLGVLAMSAMGAAFQLLPVATQQPLAALWPARLGFWLLVPGVVVLAFGMARGGDIAQATGGALAAAGLVLYGAVVADNLRRARGLAVVVSHAWAALAALAALLVLGLLLVTNPWSGFLPDMGGAGAAHLVVAAYGFMGLLAIGFSAILVPMFVLAPAPPKRLGFAVLALAVAAVVLAAGGALVGRGGVAAAGAVAGLGAAAGYLWAMAGVVRRRMRKRLGRSFVLFWVSWAFLPASLVLGLLLALEREPEHGAALFGGALLVGWLLTFVLAVLQRIAPFLASMHASRGRAPPLVSALTPEAPLAVHFYCHLAALAVLALGLATGRPPVVALGAALGLAGAVAFAWFFIGVLARLRRAMAPASPPEPPMGKP